MEYPESNVFYYRTLPLQFSEELLRKNVTNSNQFLTISAQSRRGFVLEALPTKEGSHPTAILYRPNTLPNLTTIEEGKAFFQEEFPFTTNTYTDDAIMKFITSKDFKFPKFHYVYPKLHYQQHIVLLGDAIHSVKPYFGLGVNAGFQDVTVLQESLQRNNYDLTKALPDFSLQRAKEAKALVSMQYRADRNFFPNFILPIIIDKTFRKLPVFKNIIADTIINCFQDESYTYTGALRRKVQDRIIQITSLAIIITAFLATGKEVTMRGIFPLLKRFMM